MICTRYDPKEDRFRVEFGPAGSVASETREVAAGVTLDLDTDGDVIGVEVAGVLLRLAARPAADAMTVILEGLPKAEAPDKGLPAQED